MRTVIKRWAEESQDGRGGQSAGGCLTSELHPKEEHSPQPAGAAHRGDTSGRLGRGSSGNRHSFQVLDDQMKEEFLKPSQHSRAHSFLSAWPARQWLESESAPCPCSGGEVRPARPSSECKTQIFQVSLISSASHIPLLVCVAIIPPPSFHLKPLPSSGR